MEMAFDVEVLHPVLQICVCEMSPFDCPFFGVLTHTTELGEGIEGSLTCCLLVCKCLQEACGSVHTGEGIFESLADKHRYSCAVYLLIHTKQVYLYTCSITVFAHHSSERTNELLAVTRKLPGTDPWWTLLYIPLPHLLSSQWLTHHRPVSKREHSIHLTK